MKLPIKYQAVVEACLARAADSIKDSETLDVYEYEQAIREAMKAEDWELGEPSDSDEA